jgi:hypothetical protein
VIRALVLLLLAPLPALSTRALAQNTLSGEVLFDTFAERCKAIDADPEAAFRPDHDTNDGFANGTVTRDKAILEYTEYPNLPGDVVYASLFYYRLQFPGGTSSNCVLSVTLKSPGTPFALPEMADLVKARAENFLGGPVTQLGGDVIQDGQLGRILVWTAGGSPHDPSLSLTNWESEVFLSAQLPPAAN